MAGDDPEARGRLSIHPVRPRWRHVDAFLLTLRMLAARYSLSILPRHPRPTTTTMTSSAPPWVWLLFVAACLAAHAIWQRTARSSRSSLPLPPGPRRLPLLGNLFDIPRKSAWTTFTAWSHKYGTFPTLVVFYDHSSLRHSHCAGDVVYLEVLGHPIILLNTVQATSDLLEGRFGIYSDRPRFPLMDLYVSRHSSLPTFPLCSALPAVPHPSHFAPSIPTAPFRRFPAAKSKLKLCTVSTPTQCSIQLSAESMLMHPTYDQGRTPVELRADALRQRMARPAPRVQREVLEPLAKGTAGVLHVASRVGEQLLEERAQGARGILGPSQAVSVVCGM